jgi:hypothetical protein
MSYGGILWEKRCEVGIEISFDLIGENLSKMPFVLRCS